MESRREKDRIMSLLCDLPKQTPVTRGWMSWNSGHRLEKAEEPESGAAAEGLLRGRLTRGRGGGACPPWEEQ